MRWAISPAMRTGSQNKLLRSSQTLIYEGAWVWPVARLSSAGLVDLDLLRSCCQSIGWRWRRRDVQMVKQATMTSERQPPQAAQETSAWRFRKWHFLLLVAGLIL